MRAPTYRAFKLRFATDPVSGRRAGTGTFFVYEAATVEVAQGMARSWIPGCRLEPVEASRVPPGGSVHA